MRSALNSLPLPQALRGRPLLPLLLAYLAGLLLAYALVPRWGGTALLRLCPLLLILAALLALGLCLLTRFRLWQPLLILGAGLGFFLCAGEYAKLEAFRVPEGEYVSVEGRLRGGTQAGEDGSYSFRLAVARVDDTTTDCADLLVYADGQPPPPNSRVQIDGRVFYAEGHANANSFSYSQYLRYRGIAACLSAYGYGGNRVLVLEEGPRFSWARMGQELRAALDKAAAPLSQRQRALVYGVFLGEKSGLDQSLYDSLALSGMMHAFAVSGLHVGYIVLLARVLAGGGFGRRKRRFALTLLLLAVYLSLTGLAAAILRSALMALTLYLADLLMEENDSISCLALAALLCLIAQPLWLFDAGCQLSFAAMWGLIVLTPALRPLFGSGWAAKVLAPACAATLADLPLVAYYFYYISWVGWLLSPLVLPLVGLTVMLAFVALPLSLLWPVAATPLLWAGGVVMEALAAVAKAASSLPGAATLTGAVTLPAMLACYPPLLALPAAHRRWGRLVLPLLLLLTLLPLVPWRTAPAWPDGALAQVVILDVGQGDAAFIRGADGKTMLIDGGGDPRDRGAVGQYDLLPYLRSQGVGRIDLAVSSHPDLDHCDGLISVLGAMPVRTLLFADAFPDDEIQAELLTAARANRCQLTAATAGDSYQLGDYLRLDVLSPAPGSDSQDNDASLVLKLTCGQTELLFTGDAGGEILAGLGEIDCDLLKLPHHGSASGYNEEFYRRADPTAVIFSVGAENSYGHPAAKVVEYWRERALILRTDQQGALTITIDNHGWSLNTEKTDEESAA